MDLCKVMSFPATEEMKIENTFAFSFRRFFGSSENIDGTEVIVGSSNSGGGGSGVRGLRKSLSKLSFLLPQEWNNRMQKSKKIFSKKII